MEKSDTPSTPTPTPTQSQGVTFRYLQVVLLVAIVLATLFTAWTPAGLLPGGLAGLQLATPYAVATEAGWPTATPRPQPRIGLVAGHWSKDQATYDPGAVCSDALGGVKEVDVNYGVAVRVQQLLSAQGFQVDIFEEWDDRLSIYRAMALVAIHTDSCEYINPEATGFRVAPTTANDISARLAACLQDRYAADTSLPLHHGITPDMTGYHAFAEIHNETPAAIIEIGFLNLNLQTLTQNQGAVAAGIANGILCFVHNESITPPTATASAPVTPMP